MRENETIFIKNQVGQEGMAFANVVAKLKSDINPDEMGITVKKVSKTKEGDLVMIVKEKTAGARRKLVAEIESANVCVKELKMAIILSNLDEFAEAQDLKKAITETLDAKDSEITVGEIRKSHVGTFSAVVVMPTQLGKRMIAIGSMKIGWTWAKVREMLNPKYCRNCQRYGHLATSCKQKKIGVELCRRCGGEGHKAKGCEKGKSVTSARVKGIVLTLWLAPNSVKR